MADTERKDTRAGDAWGGLASMLVALPSSIAYGVAIYAPLGGEFVARGAMAGVLGTVAIGLVAPLFGGTRRLISAPCAPAYAVMGAFVQEMASGAGGAPGRFTPDQVIVAMTLVGLLAGFLQLAYGAIGGGRLIKYVPYPVVAGYLSGVGVIILVGQVPKLFGLFDLPPGMSPWTALVTPATWKTPGLAVGLVTMAGMLFASRVTKAVPAPIVGLLAGIGFYFALGAFMPELLQRDGNPLVIGSLAGVGESFAASFSARWHDIGGLRLGELPSLLMPAITLSVLLSIDTLKTCVVVDALTRSRHDSNRELRGQGLGNLASAVAGGMPGAGTSGATLVNLHSGGSTQLSGVLEGVFALLAYVLLGGLIAWVPFGALAGILIVVAVRMIDRQSIHLLRHPSTFFDFAVIAAVAGTAVGVGLVEASGVGLALAILLFIREQIRGTVIRRKVHGDRISSRQHRLPEERAILTRNAKLLTVCELQGSLFFGTTDQLFTELEGDLKTGKYIVLGMRRVVSVDFTAVHMLEQIEGMLTDRGGTLVLSELPATLPSGQDLPAYLDQVGLVARARNVRVFEELDDALEWAEERILDDAGYERATSAAPLDLGTFDLMKEFDAASLEAIRRCVAERSVAAGQAVFRQGDQGDEIFLIRRGRVRILLPLEGGKRHHLATLPRGIFFGEIAFLDRGERSADAIAVTDAELYVVSRARFDALAMEHPVVCMRMFFRIARALALRLRQTDAELRAFEQS